MKYSRTETPSARSVDELAGAEDLRSVISAALTAQPIDDQSLRCGVWTYVGAERDAGSSPGRVIAALSDLVESAIVPIAPRRELTRRVILWSVEAYFGHLGGGGVERTIAAGGELALVPLP